MLRAKAPFEGILKALCCLISVRLHVLESKTADADVLPTENPLSGPSPARSAYSRSSCMGYSMSYYVIV